MYRWVAAVCVVGSVAIMLWGLDSNHLYSGLVAIWLVLMAQMLWDMK